MVMPRMVFCAKEVVVSVTFSVSPESLGVIGLQSEGSNNYSTPSNSAKP